MPFPFAAAALALQGAGLGYSIFGGGRRSPAVPDISAELAKIDAIITQAREQARIAVNREAVASRKQLLSSLANRGVLESPAATISLEELEGTRLGAIARSEAQLLSQGASLRAGVLTSLTGQRLAAETEASRLAVQERAGLAAGLTGLGTSLLFFGSGAQTSIPTSTPSSSASPFFAAGRDEFGRIGFGRPQYSFESGSGRTRFFEGG